VDPSTFAIVLCVIDPRSADLSSLEALSQRFRTYSEAKLVCLFLAENDAAVVAAIRAGASGIISGGSDNDFDIASTIAVIERVSNGEFVMPSSLALRLARLHANELATTLPTKDDALTQREQEVLKLLAQGKTNRDIATCLSLSEHTVRSHLRGIMQKLQVTNRVQAAALAWSGSLVEGMAGKGGALSGNSSR
jgi:DNA-binding NarL/FixJ family response regulator